jgi:hypothetical protein
VDWEYKSACLHLCRKKDEVVRGGKLGGVTARSDILSRLIEPEFVTVFGGH